MKNIMTVVGARPQFVKAATVSRAFRNAGIVETVVHTGQHSDANMSDIFFDELEIKKPDFYLGINGLSHGAMTGEMLRRIEEVILQRKPDALLVFGDTNSTLAGALAAAKLHVPVAHVEAGLRSFNMRMPEEINRVLTDRVSKWLFCPTGKAVQNLGAEGFKAPAYDIENVGDVMYDATLYYKNRARWPHELPMELQSKAFAVCTLHRQESIDNPIVFKDLIEALNRIALEIPVVWPVHPRAKKKLEDQMTTSKGLHLISPVGYLEMLALLEACRFVATDSGGLQKEAYFFGKPCLTLRTETEWTELVDAGANLVCGHDVEKIVDAAAKAVPFAPGANFYGSGDASSKIARRIVG